MANDVRHSVAFTNWLFLRVLGLVYAIAFASAAMQITSLVGAEGLLPAERYLQMIAAHVEPGFLAAPTLAWLNSSDLGLNVICWGGFAAALLVVAGVLTLPSLAMCYVLYLSIVNIGQDFFSFQWDWLLIECGFAALFLAPSAIFEFPLSKRPKFFEPNIWMFWVVRLIVFKLMFMSGICKIASHDPTWVDLSALQYHYETQPLPTPVGWLFGQIPFVVQKCSVIMMFFIELIVPWFIFINRRLRFIAAFLIAALQCLIALTGNYTFFNLLSLALCICLLDDGFLSTLKCRIERFGNAVDVVDAKSNLNRSSGKIFIVLALILFFLDVRAITHIDVPPIAELGALVAPFGVSNGYGLFAVMTTVRNEIVIEGSNDGQTWLAYELPYKPGRLNRSPPVVAPFQPRLDWQLWFASLSNYEQEPWFGHLMYALLKGSPNVLKLFSHNPFPPAPPRFIRASMYTYKFTDLRTFVRTGEWWSRSFSAPYFPTASLQGPK